MINNENRGVKMKICKNCGFQNDDLSVYCSSCGSLLDSAGTRFDSTQETPNDSGAYQQNGYSQAEHSSNAGQNQYSQNNYNYGSQQYAYSPEPKVSTSKGMVIASLVVGLFLGGLIGVVFAVLALVAYGDYESAVLRRDFVTAAEKSEKIKKYNKLAWIFDFIGIALVVIAVIFTFAAGFLFVSQGGAGTLTDIPTDFFEYGFGNFESEVFGAVISLASSVF